MRQVIRRTLPKKVPKGMIEMFTTPRQKEANIVKSLLRKAGIRYKSQEEDRSPESGWRYCIYVPALAEKRAYRVIDEGLMEKGI